MRGTELVKILEASSESLRLGGAPVDFAAQETNVRSYARGAVARGAKLETSKLLSGGMAPGKKHSPRPARKAQIKIVLNGNGQ